MHARYDIRKAPQAKRESVILPSHMNKPYSKEASVLRTLGNQLQTKLELGAVGDHYEREADMVADKLQSPSQSFISSPGRPNYKSRSTDGLSLGHALGSGQMIEAKFREPLEQSYHRDLSRIKIYSNEQASLSARSINAKAYTVGENIVFARNQYQPHTQQGKRLLTHELTHVVQQTGGGFVGKQKMKVSSRPQAAIQRTPGVDAEDSWNVIVDSFTAPEDAGRRQAAAEAKNRMLRTAQGANLVNGLWRVFCGGRTNCRSHIAVNFTEQLPPGHSEASGMFEPSHANAPRYNVWVLSRRPRDPNSRGVTIGGQWPSQGRSLITFTYGDPESSMASTLYHEMLHVWYVHSGRRQIGFPTGHGDVARGEIEPDFLDALRQFSREMSALENRIDREAQEARRQPVPSPEPIIRSEDRPSSEPPEVRRPSGPSFVGGSVMLRGGGAGNEAVGGQGVGILNADLVLGRISSFNIGVRGIYLSPDNSLLGGGIGYRFVQEDDGPASFSRTQNPMFFDLEAGVLAELPTSEVDRLMGSAHFLLSAGVGQEIGRQGPRFFWRIGGFALISDEGSAIGGGTGGVGLRFQ